MSPDTARLGPEKQALPQSYLSEENSSTAGEQPILAGEAAGSCSLSLAQQYLWSFSPLEPGDPAHHLPLAIRLCGALHREALERSLSEIVRRHAALRTAFTPTEGDEPIQVVLPARPVARPVVDLCPFPPSERKARAELQIREEIQRPFDLAHGPLYRALLLRLEEEEHLLLVTLHHLIADHWSADILFGELAVLYEAYSSGCSSPLPELPIQYSDFALWQRHHRKRAPLAPPSSSAGQRAGAAPAALDLPTDRPRSAAQTYRATRLPLTLPETLTSGIQELSRQEDVPLFVTLLAAFETLLARYTGQEEITVGTTDLGRDQVEIQGLMGLFAVPRPVRVDLSGSPTFRQILHRVEAEVQRRGDRDEGYAPVMFAMPDGPMPAQELPGLILSRIEVVSGLTRYDLTLSLAEHEQRLIGSLEYRTDLFDAATIERMSDHLQTLLEGIVADPDQPFSLLPLLTEAERQQLLVEWNHAAVGTPPLPSAACLHQLFEEQAVRTPDAVAVVFEDRWLTYCELNYKANQLAHYLRALGVRPHTLVGIYVQRSLEMVVGLLGILKAGGAYVPLDPVYPRERLAFMVRDAQLSVLVTQEALIGELPIDGPHRVCLDADRETIARQSGENLAGGEVEGAGPRARGEGDAGDEPAYVIYTSGSTGTPKGVPISHRAVVNLLASMRRRPGLTDRDVLLAVTTLSFDIATLELFLPLTVGARVVIVAREVASDGRQLAHRLADCGATVMQATPATWRLLLESGWQGSSRLKILCGGEALSRELASQLLQRGASLWNLYGPTEAAIYSTAEEVGPGTGPVSIGRPIDNTELYLLDRHGQPVPIGVPGELYIGGAGLARGYLGRPELTRERFVPHPFSDQPEARLYRTGDLARYRPDGRLEFLGRLDHQVKIRGFRVELGEIEALLREHRSVRDCAVLARQVGSEGALSGNGSQAMQGDSPADERLVAYVIPQPDAQPPVRELSRFLQEKLPDYMVPSAFVMLAGWPLTPNGKLDRRALPAPDWARPDLEEMYTAPRDPLEVQLTQIWEKVLGVEPIGVRDNFFDLGGHSLLAVRLFTQIENSYGWSLPLVTLLRAPTVEQLARTLREESSRRVGPAAVDDAGRTETGAAPLPSSLVPIQPCGSKRPFFCIHGVGGHVLCYRNLPRHLGPDQPVYGLYGLQPARPNDGATGGRERGGEGARERGGEFGRRSPIPPSPRPPVPLSPSSAISVEEMAAHYLGEMRAVQPEGPYSLGGFSFGGVVAYEMARQLHQQGEAVALLALFDSEATDYPRTHPLLRSLLGHVKALARMGTREKLQYVGDRAARVIRHLESGVRKRGSPRPGGTPGDRPWAPPPSPHPAVALPPLEPAPGGQNGSGRETELLPRALQDAVRINLQAMRDYRMKAYAGRVTLFQAAEEREAGACRDPALGWGRWAAGGVEVYQFPGAHATIMEEPLVGTLAEQLKACLRAADPD